jgi:hypothetical protein
MPEQDAQSLYDRIISFATLPALLLCIALSVIIIRMLLSPKWQQARRNKQILKARAERQRDAERKAREEAENREDAP